MPLTAHHEKLLIMEEILEEALGLMDSIPHDAVEKKHLKQMETFAACLDDVAEQLNIVLEQLGPYEEPVIANPEPLESDRPATVIDVPFSVVQ